MTATMLATLLAIVVNAPAQGPGPERRDRDRCPRDVSAAFVQLNNTLRVLGDDIDRVSNERDRRKLRGDLTAAIRATERARNEACDSDDRHPHGPPVVIVPAPLPEPRMMSPAAFTEFLTTIKREHFDEGRTTVVMGAMAGDICITSDQAKAVIGLPAFTDGRMDVARLMLPRIVDVERSYLLSQAFVFDSDKKELAKLLPTAGTHPACQRPR